MDGNGSVKILSPTPPFWRWVGRNWLLVVSIGLMCLGLLLPLSGLIVAMMIQIRRSTSGRPE
jgi:ABC-type uncharacterized transport system permease subunit